MKKFGAISLIVFLMAITSVVQAQEIRTMTTQTFLEEMAGVEEGTVVINFWATWCGPCVEELPHFNRMARENADENVSVIFVSLDFDESSLSSFLETHELEGEVIFLSNGLRDPDWIEKIATDWSGAIPATLGQNYETEAKAFHEGSFTYEELLAWLRPSFISSN